MATFLVIGSGQTPNPNNPDGFIEVRAGQEINVADGDIIIFSPDANATTSLNGSGDIEIRIDESNANSFDIDVINGGIRPTVNVANDVDAGAVNIDLSGGNVSALNVGDNVTLNNVQLSNVPDSAVIGDNVTFNGEFDASGGNDTLVAGKNLTVTGTLDGGAGTDRFTIDDGFSTDAAQLTLGAGNDTLQIGELDTLEAFTVDGGAGNDSLFMFNQDEAVRDALEASPDYTDDNGDGIFQGDGEAVPVGDLEIAQFSVIGPDLENPFICFTDTTSIETDLWPVAAGALKPGMKVKTMDSGMCEVRWVGRRTFKKADLNANPDLRPVRIRAGVFGQGLPLRDLVISPQHRVLVISNVAEKMFGEREVLIAAKHLLAIDGVEIATDVEEVTYVHFLCDKHEIVFAEGVPSETLYAGREALRSVGEKALEEIFAIFPELRNYDASNPPPSVRPMAKGRLGRRMSTRIAKNEREPLEIRR